MGLAGSTHWLVDVVALTLLAIVALFLNPLFIQKPQKPL
jgi:hypothetical protein